MVCPSAAILFATSGCFLTFSPTTKKVAFIFLAFSTSSTALVFSAEGPSSKVRYMVLGLKYRSMPLAIPPASFSWYCGSVSRSLSQGLDRNPVSIRHDGTKVCPVTVNSASPLSSRASAPVLLTASLWTSAAKRLLSEAPSFSEYQVSIPLAAASSHVF